jgi:4-alpha-glucanotransferase
MGATTRESKPAFDFHRRSSGVLMHLTSLPGPHGNGDLGDEAHRFVDRLAEAGQTWWQVLPIGPAGRAPAFSPYDSASAFAGNPLLVSLSDLHRQKLLPPRDLRPAKGLSAGRVNFPVAERFRVERLRRAFATFRRRGGHHSRAYRAFCDRAADWLDDFALFAALKQSYGADRSWTTWDSRVRDRHPDALRAARKELADEIACQCFIQFQFDQQWRRLREHAHRRGIGLIGDRPSSSRRKARMYGATGSCFNSCASACHDVYQVTRRIASTAVDNTGGIRSTTGRRTRAAGSNGG